MNTITALIAVLALTTYFTDSSLAQTSVPHTFESGQPARADQINENFAVLAEAFDENANKIEANKAAIENNADQFAEQLANMPNSEAIVLDFQDPNACIIDEPGFYVLDRSWDFGDTQEDLCFAGPTAASNDAAIQITGNFVTLDLNGFTIDGGNGKWIQLEISGWRVRVQNGAILGTGVDGDETTVLVSGPDARLQNLVLSRIQLDGFHGVLSSSEISGEGISVTGSRSVARDLTVNCSERLCAYASDGGIIRNNNINCNREGACVRVAGDAVFESNTLEVSEFTVTAVRITGSASIVARNTIGRMDETAPPIILATAINVETGSNSVVDSNIVLSGFDTGIAFFADGNFYGDNRVSASTAFDLGGTVQTDWGGNVSF